MPANDERTGTPERDSTRGERPQRINLPEDEAISAVEEFSEKARERGNPKAPVDERGVTPDAPD